MPTAQKKKQQCITTPPGVAVYPKLTEPDTKFNKNGVYSIRHRIENPEQEAALIEKLTALFEQSYVNNCKAEKKKSLKKADFPWKPETRKEPTGERDEDGEEIFEDVETGYMLFNYKMTASGVTKEGKKWTRKPSLFDAHGHAMMGDADLKIGGGSLVKVSFTVGEFYTSQIGSGITLRLEAVQILDLKSYGERSATQYGFGKEDGYTAAAEPSEEAAASAEGADSEEF